MTEKLRKVDVALSDKVAAAAEPYAVGAVSEVAHVFSNGRATKCFRVVAEARVYALHLFPERSLDRIESVLSAQTQLARGGVLCKRPVPSETGAYCSTIPGSVAAMLDWQEGTALAEHNVPVPECVGRTAAQLHTKSESLTGPESIIPTVPQLLAKIRRSMKSGVRRSGEDLCRWMERVLDSIPSGSAGPHGLIHNDIHHRNIIISRSRVPCLIDFGNCEHQLLTKDIGVALFYVLQVAEHPSTCAIARLLRAYCEIRPLSAVDVLQALHFLRLKALEVLAWQFLRYMRSEAEHATVASARELALLVERIAHVSYTLDLLSARAI